MVVKEASAPSHRPRVREQGMVPFLWEERPGILKKDWKLDTVAVSVNTVTPPPVKLVASVPFIWEEKPGTPHHRLSQPCKESPVLPLPPSRFICFPSPSKYSPHSSPSTNDGNVDNMNDDNNDCSDDDGAEKDENNSGQEEDMFELDFESINFDTDGSFESAPSLLANRLLPATALSSAVPVDENYVKKSLAKNTRGGREAPGSPASETDSTTSSYATGSTSLVGASFLECLFPLFSPDYRFLDKAHFHEKSLSLTLTDPYTEFGWESNCNPWVRRTPTLGELIRMSRRRSCQTRTIAIKKQKPPLGFMKKTVFGCCMFGSDSNHHTRGSGSNGSHRRHQSRG